MTSPRQRKKRAAILQKRLKKLDKYLTQTQIDKLTTLPEKPVAPAPESVVKSPTPPKPKNPKNALVELNSQDQVVEQKKEEVKITEKE